MLFVFSFFPVLCRCVLELTVSGARFSAAKGSFNILDEHALPKDHPAFDTAEQAAKRRRAADSFASAGNKVLKRAREAGGREEEEQDRSRRKREKKERSGSRKDRTGERERHGRSKEERERITWVVPHLRVRVVSKSWKDGRYYNRKGVVVDVISRTLFTILMDEGSKLVENCKQKYAQTALPKPGGRVKIVAGLKTQARVGEVGTLLERNSKKQEGAVQLDDDSQIEVVSYESLCEYAGR